MLGMQTHKRGVSMQAEKKIVKPQKGDVATLVDTALDGPWLLLRRYTVMALQAINEFLDFGGFRNQPIIGR